MARTKNAPPAGPRHHIGAPPRQSDKTKRTNVIDESVSFWAWPSRGGIIVLERVTPLDLHFLNLRASGVASTHMLRDEDPVQEDQFCRQLLLLGAIWYDSRDRYGYIGNVKAGFEEDIFDGRNSLPTTVERRCVKVGYPASGGLWVAEYECLLPGLDSSEPPPEDVALVDLAADMEEKCEMIKALPGAKFYDSPDQYEGHACLNAWDTKHTGEFGPLEL